MSRHSLDVRHAQAAQATVRNGAHVCETARARVAISPIYPGLEHDSRDVQVDGFWRPFRQKAA
jgi:hypothetical protein